MNCRLLEAALKLLCQEQTSGPAISLTKPTPTLKRSFRSVYTTPMFGSCERSKKPWLESDEEHSASARCASNLSRNLDWKRCPGPASVASVRTDRAVKGCFLMMMRNSSSKQSIRSVKGTSPRTLARPAAPRLALLQTVLRLLQTPSNLSPCATNLRGIDPPQTLSLEWDNLNSFMGLARSSEPTPYCLILPHTTNRDNPTLSATSNWLEESRARPVRVPYSAVPKVEVWCSPRYVNWNLWVSHLMRVRGIGLAFYWSRVKGTVASWAGGRSAK